MLTRLHVQGFKNLLDVEVQFGPFTCIAGTNGVGKSNLFDAIHFLHLLTQHPIMEAARRLRETDARALDPRSLFTSFGSFRSEELRLTADLVLEREVEDDFGVSAQASIATARYEVAFRLNDEVTPERLELVEETLVPISLTEARRDLGPWATKRFKASAVTGRRTKPFISTETGESGPVVQMHQEGHGGRKFPAPRSSVTVLGSQVTTDFPTILAVRREISSWKTLLLEPSAMRAAASYRDPKVIDPRGAYLPAAIERLRLSEEEGRVYAEIANRLADLLDDVQEIRIVDDEKTETWTLEVRAKDGVFHPARSLSDGTLRFLVLTTLAFDRDVRGLVCLEEPENGIHPARIPSLVELLREIAVDPMEAVGADNPLRQVIINTHSPVVVENIAPKELVYLGSKSVVKENSPGRVVHPQLPPGSWRLEADKMASQMGQGDAAPYLRPITPSPGEPVQMWLDCFAPSPL